MDRLEAMAMLLVAIDKGSLSAGAREMGIPIPTFSRKVTDLETFLGAQLLIRTTRKLSLTDAGVAYVASARKILGQVADAEREASGEFRAPKGELVLTASLLFGHLHVMPIIADFLAAYPAINIRLVQADRYTDFIEGHIDMAVRFGMLPDSEMVATRVGSMRSIICGAPGLLAMQGRPQTPDDLRRFPCIATSGPMLSANWRFQDPVSLAHFDMQIAPRLVVSSALSALDAAVRGIGLVRLLYYQAVDALKSGSLQLLLEEYEPQPEPVQIVHIPHSQMPLKLRKFIDFATPRLRASLSGIDEARSKR